MVRARRQRLKTQLSWYQTWTQTIASAMLCTQHLVPAALKGRPGPLPVTTSISLFSFQDQLLQRHLCTGSVWWLQNVGERQRTVSALVTARLCAGRMEDSLGPQGSGGCLAQSPALCSCVPAWVSCTCGLVILSLWAGLTPRLLSLSPCPTHTLLPQDRPPASATPSTQPTWSCAAAGA